MNRTIIIQTSKWVWNENTHLHHQISDLVLLRKTRLIKSQEEGVGWNHHPILFQRHSTNLYSILILELISDFQLGHA